MSDHTSQCILRNTLRILPRVWYNMTKGVIFLAIKIHLSRILGERRINISELAKMACISRNTATALYHEDAKGITWDVLEKLCSALNCQPGDLMEYVSEKQDE